MSSQIEELVPLFLGKVNTTAPRGCKLSSLQSALKFERTNANIGKHYAYIYRSRTLTLVLSTTLKPNNAEQ